MDTCACLFNLCIITTRRNINMGTLNPPPAYHLALYESAHAQSGFQAQIGMEHAHVCYFDWVA
ncbi:hypothetical protein PG993_002341 [Apiospora rasikravindrae]|uniref:Uncharacterized protein n=1 Tax=Apiospora rasikravindrae TaxID=990691 RepID=A0ABR1TWC4_9PEZI